MPLWKTFPNAPRFVQTSYTSGGVMTDSSPPVILTVIPCKPCLYCRQLSVWTLQRPTLCPPPTARPIPTRPPIPTPRSSAVSSSTFVCWGWVPTATLLPCFQATPPSIPQQPRWLLASRMLPSLRRIVSQLRCLSSTGRNESGSLSVGPKKLRLSRRFLLETSPCLCRYGRRSRMRQDSSRPVTRLVG